MVYPNKQQENRLYKLGYKSICGLDEAGRGAWAGPIVAGAIILPKNFKPKKIKIKDSKLLTANQRQIAFNWLKENCLDWSVGVVSQETIDKIGIVPANILAFKKALKNLENLPDYILVDAINFKFKKINIESIIRGDRMVFSIAAASIIAKVSRDELLKKYHHKFPLYGFDQHKGYGTKKHYQMICQHGICRIHRKTYRPIQGFM